MHSRIFQLESKLEYVKEYQMTEETIIGDYDGPFFVGTVADYVSEDTDREMDIVWLKDEMSDLIEKGLVVFGENDSITFKEGFKHEYFKSAYEGFKRLANETTIDNFIDSFHAYRIRLVIDEKYGFYIYEDSTLKTLDSFVRWLPDEETTYYIGTTLDYHS